MTRSDMQLKVRNIREELESRYKHGTMKLADEKGEFIPTAKLQDELYSLIYKLSKMD